MLKRSAGSLALLLVAWIASGCASLNSGASDKEGQAAPWSGIGLYSETRDKQGQAAKEAWSKVDLQAQLAVPRKNLQVLLDEQLLLEDELWSTRREALARAMAYGWTVDKFNTAVKEGFERVAGTGADLVALAKAQKDIATAAKVQAIQVTAPLSLGIPMPSCELIAASETDKKQQETLDKLEAAQPAGTARDTLTNAIKNSRGDCKVLVRGLHGVAVAGELGRASKALTDEQTALKDERKKADDARAEYQAALSEYEEAAAKLQKKSDDSVAKVKEAMDRLAGVIDGLKSAEDVFSVQLVSEARIASLDRFLATYSDVLAGKGTPEDASKAAIALALFPDLVNKAQQSLKDLEKPNLVPLVIEKKVEQARLAAAERDIATRNSVIALRQAHYDLLLAQLDAYQRAQNWLGTAGAGTAKLVEVLQPVPNTKDMSAAAKSQFESRKNLWMATSLYLDAEGRLRAEVGKTRYRITALVHEKALTYAESNIRQWQVLIDPSVEIMAMYGASGLKSSDIAAFINSLTLLWIAVGVN